MEGSTRNTLGERMVERLTARERRRPRIGFTPAFYARLGLEDPWAAPEGSVRAPDSAEGLVFLSAQPYYAMLRRLAASRRRRDQRSERFEARRAGHSMRAATRTWPGETPLGASRLARAVLDSFVLPPPLPGPAPTVAPEPEAVPGAPVRGSRRNRTLRGVRSATLEVEHPPARVVAGTGAFLSSRASASWGGGGPAPLRNASPGPRAAASDLGAAGSSTRAPSAPGAAPRSTSLNTSEEPAGVPPAVNAARLARTRRAASAGVFAAAAEVLEAEIQTAAPARRRVIIELRAAIAQLPFEEQVLAVQRVVGSLGVASRTAKEGPALRSAAATPAARVRRLAPVPVVGTADLDAAVSRGPRAESAVTRAANRLDSAAPTGLRPLLSRSPALALAASAATDRAASGTLAEAERTQAVPAATRRERVRATSRAAARADGWSPRAGSLVAAPLAAARAPAGRPLAASPVFRSPAPAAETSASPARARVPSFAPRSAEPTADGVPPTFAPLPRPQASSARAVARLLATLPGTANGPSAHEDARFASTREERAAIPMRSASETVRAPRLPRAEQVIVRGNLSAAPPLEDGTSPAASTGAALPRPGAPDARRTVAGTRTVSPAAQRGLSATTWADARVDQGVTGTGSSLVPRVGAPRPRTSVLARSGSAAAPVFASASSGVASSGVARSGVARSGFATAPVFASASSGVAAVGPAALSAVAETRTEENAARRAGSALPARPSTIARGEPAVTTGPARGEGASLRQLSPIVAASRRADRPSVSAVDLQNERPSILAGGASPERTPTRRAAPTGPLRFARGLRADDMLPLARAPEAQEAALVSGTRSVPPERRAPTTTARRAENASAQAPRSLRDAAVARTSTVSANTLVRAPEGAYVSARAAVARGLRILATPNGLIAATVAEAEAASRPQGPNEARTTTRSATRGSGVRMPTVAFPVAVAGMTEAGDDRAAFAELPRRRATARAAARAQVTDATAYRGALRGTALSPVVLQGAEPPPSSPPLSPPSVREGAPSARGALPRAGSTLAPRDADLRSGGSPDAARGATRRSTRTGAVATSLAATGAPSAAAALDGASDAVRGPAQRAPRARLEDRLAHVAEGRTDGGTGWIDRAEGSPRLRTVSSLLQALARASSNEDVVRVIAARGELSSQGAALPLDSPAVQVIQQIRAEVNDQVRVVAEPVYVPSQETRSSRLRAPEATALGRSALGSTTSRSRSLRSSAVRAAESTARRAGGAEDRLSKLVRRLQDLIHLAEDQNRLAEARGQVRLAEDSAEARAEGQAHAQGAGPHADVETHDIEALGREVLDAVSKEMELRRSRRMEDGDESPWW